VGLQVLGWIVAACAALVIVVAVAGKPHKTVGIVTGSFPTSSTSAATSTTAAVASTTNPALVTPDTSSPTTTLAPTTTTPAVTTTQAPTTSQPATTTPATTAVNPTTIPTSTIPVTTISTGSLCGAPANPFGYNFCSRGGHITQPAATTCSYFNCIATFDAGQGYMIECADLMYSMSGGLPGACSQHGGEKQAVFAGP
jgi:hypothetical protein